MHRFSDVVKGLIVSAIVFVSGPPAGLAHEDEEPLHLIQTSATAEEDVTPDSVSLSLEVMTQAETVEQARSENAERMGRLLEAVKAHGWKELTTQTGRFSVTPVYEKIDRKFIQDLPKILGYQISHLLVVKLEALDGELVGPALFADWGDGFSEDSYARLKAGPDGWFASLPARSRQLLRLRLDPSEGPCRFTVLDIAVKPAGHLGKDPRGWKGVAIQAIKPALGPLRQPVGAIWRKGRAVVEQARDSRAKGGDAGPVRATYVHAIQVSKNLRSPHFAAPIAAPITLPADAPKVVAFYLPQFHPFPENDAWWGKGFTEWTNVSKAQPQFLGHYQPRLPGDLGFYDLRQREVLAQQVGLAKGAGVHAFCFHYYWFAGKRLLEKPIELYLADPTLDLPFALCWANENWTRRWDGDETDVLMAQKHSPEDDEAVFEDMARYIRDPRYLRVGGKPVLVLYRPEILPDAKATTDRWRAKARAMGLGELRLLCTTAFGFQDYAGHGFDGIIDFPPHAIVEGEITKAVTPLHENFTGKVYDYPAVVRHKLSELSRVDAAYVPGVMPGWDNQARKPWAGHAFHNADPESYLTWLSGALTHAVARHPKGEAMVFVNAWNEWAEGAHLEPDQRFGHGWLEAVKNAADADLLDKS